MSLFQQILQGYDPEAEDYFDPDYAGEPRLDLDIPGDLKREVLADVQPEQPATLTGFAANAGKDVGRFVGGLGAMLGEVLTHPVRSAKAVGGALATPVETAKKLGQPIVDKYTPRAGEGVVSMLARNAYDEPFSTLMDASAIVSGPFGGAAKLARLTGGARAAEKLEAVASAARSMDPITIAQQTGRKLLKSKVPDAYARLRVQSAAADRAAEEATRQDWLTNDFNTRLAEASAHLNSAEMYVRFPYAEGRVPIIKDDVMTEITHRGMLESRKVEAGVAIRKEALDEFTAKYRALQEEYEVAAGLAPEQFADLARQRSLREATANAPGSDPLANEMIAQEAYDAALTEATERKLKRATKSTMTALDVAKEKDFRVRAAELAQSQHTFDLEETMSMMPYDRTTTIEEAMAVMGDKVGIIVPHSNEVMTQGQSTVRNLVTKIGESSAYKENTGYLFRNGVLENTDPAANLARVYRTAVRGDTLTKVVSDAVDVGVKEGFAEWMPPGWKPQLDERIKAGTHQPVHPASMHLDGTLQEHYDRVLARVTELADEPGFGDLDASDLALGMARNAEKTFPLAKAAHDRVALITKAGADELAFYQRSLEPATNPLAQMSNAFMGPFNAITLNGRATRLANNGYSGMLFATLQGMHPFSFRGLDALATTGRATLGRFGVLKDEVSQKLGKIYDLPGVTSGLHSTEAFEKATNLSTRLARGEAAPRAGKLVNNPAVRLFGKYTEILGKANENLENIFRAGSLIYEMKPGGIQAVKNMMEGAAAQANFAEKISELSARGVNAMTDAGLKKAVEGMNRWTGDYKRTTAFERLVGRYVFPYHKFYKHSAELLLRFPFEKPVKGQLAAAVGGAALQDVKDVLESYGFDWNTIPEQFRTSVPVDKREGADGTPEVVMLNTKGPNPFSFLSGDAGDEAIASLHPLMKLAIEQATGVNLFTREKFQGAWSTFNGRKVNDDGAIVEDYVRPPLAEHFLRQFWPYQTLRELAAHGRVATDTADLIDLVRASEGAYQQDERGLQRRRPQPYGALTPLMRMVGPVPQVLQTPTRANARAQDAVASEQLNDLLQRHPELLDKVLDSVGKRAEKWEPRTTFRRY